MQLQKVEDFEHFCLELFRVVLLLPRRIVDCGTCKATLALEQEHHIVGAAAAVQNDPPSSVPHSRLELVEYNSRPVRLVPEQYRIKVAVPLVILV